LLSTSIPRRTRITDAETTPDGQWVALRTNEALLMYRADDLAARRMDNLWYWDLRAFGEPQGEGVAMSNEGEVYLASEGGGGDKPGTFARARCAIPAANHDPEMLRIRRIGLAQSAGGAALSTSSILKSPFGSSGIPTTL